MATEVIDVFMEFCLAEPFASEECPTLTQADGIAFHSCNEYRYHTGPCKCACGHEWDRTHIEVASQPLRLHLGNIT